MADQTPTPTPTQSIPSFIPPAESVTPKAPAGGQGAPAATQTPTVQLGNLPDNWYEGLPDDLKNEASLRNFKDVPSLAKSLVHAQKALGADKVAVPGKLATEDDWKAFYQKVGMPQNQSDYKMNLKDSKVDPDILGKFQEVAYKSNILPKQAEAIVNWFQESALQAQAKQTASYQAEQEKSVGELRKEWGQGFDAKIARAQQVVKQYADPEDIKYLAESGLGNNTRLLKIFAKMGDQFKESGILGDDPSQPTGKTPAELKAEIDSIYADKTHPYHIASHPNHAAAVAAVQNLFQKMNG